MLERKERKEVIALEVKIIDDFDDNMDDIMNSINKMLEDDTENEKIEDKEKEEK